MASSFTVEVVDSDEYYLGIEVRARSERFLGSTKINIWPTEFAYLAKKIQGFPAQSDDERIFEFGDAETRAMGGFCRLRFQTIGHNGLALLSIEIKEDDFGTDLPGECRIEFQVQANDIDRFVSALQNVEVTKCGLIELKQYT